MTAWWEARSRREQILLGALGATAALMVLWFAVVAPLRGAAIAAEQRYARAVEAERTVSRLLASAAALKGRAPATGTRPLDAVVRDTAAAAGVELARVEADPAEGLRIAIPSVAPAALFGWLAVLQRDHGVAARHLTILKNETGGLTVDATLARAGA